MGKWKWGKLVLSWCVLLAVVTACTSNGNKEPASGSATPKASATSTPAETAAQAEPMKLKWMTMTQFSEKSPQQRFLEERFNVEFELVYMESQEQIDTRIAGGEKIDFMHVNGVSRIPFTQQGLLLQLPVEELYQRLPKYMEFVDRTNPVIVPSRTVDGKISLLPKVFLTGAAPWVSFWNKAMLDEIGYEGVPKTIDEVEQLLLQLKAHNPQSYPLSASGMNVNNQNFVDIYGAYQVLPFAWNLIDGKIVHGMASDRTRELLKRLNSWFDQGLIWPEFVSNDTPKLHAMFANREVAGIPGLYDYGLNFQVFKDLKAKFGDDVVMAMPYDGPYGPGKNFAFGGDGGTAGFGAHLANEPEKLDKIFEILRGITEDEEVFLGAYYGIEGESYEIDENGKVKRLKEYGELGGMGDGATMTVDILIDTFLYKYDYTKEMEDLTVEMMAKAPEIRLVNAIYEQLPSVAEFPDFATYHQEAWLKFITGEWDVNSDQEWNAHLDRLNKQGGAKLTEEANAVYQAR